MIQTGLPVPTRIYTIKPGPKLKYPEIEVLLTGDSFFVADQTIYQMSSYAQYHKVRLNRTFACRSVVENGLTGVRVFRTS